MRYVFWIEDSKLVFIWFDHMVQYRILCTFEPVDGWVSVAEPYYENVFTQKCFVSHGISDTDFCILSSDWLAHSNAVFDVDWMPGENQLLTASGDQSIVLWDVGAEEKLSTFRGHTSSVKTVRFQFGGKGLCNTQFETSVWIWLCQNLKCFM